MSPSKENDLDKTHKITYQTTLDSETTEIPDVMIDEVLRGNLRIAKFAGSKFPYLIPPTQYTEKLGWSLEPHSLQTNFVGNVNEPVHRWLGYVQGFSASFVREMHSILKSSIDSYVMDPFMGSGTVPLESMFQGYKSIGVEINPFLHFAAKTKIDALYHGNPDEIKKVEKRLLSDPLESIDAKNEIFLRRTLDHFDPQSLKFLLNIKENIERLDSDSITYRILKLAFLSILVDASQMTRAPCMGYPKKKKAVGEERTRNLFRQRIEMMIEDIVRFRKDDLPKKYAPKLFFDDAKTCNFNGLLASTVITSPPYVNGMDYVNNYKIELVWGDFAKSYPELKKLKNAMVACDNISRNSVKEKLLKYNDKMLEDIIDRIEKSIAERPVEYRRPDQPLIVTKYFNDLYEILENTTNHIESNGQLALVVGDSLIADVYVPTDLLLANACVNHLGFDLVRILKSRDRRSGQRTTFKLRETVAILRKQ